MFTRRLGRHTNASGLLIAGVLALAISAADSPGQSTPGSESALIRQMAGTWDVRANMWLASGTKPMTLSAVADRRIVGDGLLEEVMTPAPGSGIPAFTRVALLGHNDVNGNFEYVSWDTRAPQMMYQTSHSIGVPGEALDSGVIWFYLDGSFVVPQWGTERNVAFRHRLAMEAGKDRQVLRLYWRRLSGEPSSEFLATEYVYTRKK